MSTTWTSDTKFSGSPVHTYDDATITYDSIELNYDGQEITKWTNDTKN